MFILRMDNFNKYGVFYYFKINDFLEIIRIKIIKKLI